MDIRYGTVLVAAVSVISLCGCVSSGTYQAKEQESQQLGRSLEETKNAYNELQEKCARLEASNSGQVEKLAKLSADFAALQQENAKLAEAVKPENLLKSLAETVAALQQRVDVLKAENAKMKQELLVPQKLQPVESPPRKAPLDKAALPLAPVAGTNNDLPAVPAEKTPSQPIKP